MKKRKASPRKKLVKQLDKVCAEYIKLIYPYCVQCGTRERLTCGHLITRAKYSVRWDTRNLFTQCSGCNCKHEFQPEHFTSWYLEKFGLQAYNRLVADSNQLSKFSSNDLQEKIDFFNSEIIKLKNDRQIKSTTVNKVTTGCKEYQST